MTRGTTRGTIRRRAAAHPRRSRRRHGRHRRRSTRDSRPSAAPEAPPAGRHPASAMSGRPRRRRPRCRRPRRRLPRRRLSRCRAGPTPADAWRRPATAQWPRYRRSGCRPVAGARRRAGASRREPPCPARPPSGRGPPPPSASVRQGAARHSRGRSAAGEFRVRRTSRRRVQPWLRSFQKYLELLSVWASWCPESDDGTAAALPTIRKAPAKIDRYGGRRRISGLIFHLSRCAAPRLVLKFFQISADFQ